MDHQARRQLGAKSLGGRKAKMFGIRKEEAKATFFRVFHQYRLLFAVLNVVPYVAVTIMR